MPDEPINPQESSETEEELDLESQLDAVLSQLHELEPDLVPGFSKPAQPEVAPPVTQTPDPTPQPDESEASDVPVTAQTEDAIADEAAPETAGDDEQQATEQPHEIGNQLDELIAQQIDEQIEQETDQNQTVGSADGSTAEPAGAAEAAVDPGAPGSDQQDSPAVLSAQQIDALITQEIEQQIDEELSAPAAGDVDQATAEIAADGATADSDPIAAASPDPATEEKSTAAKLDDLLNQQMAQQIDDAQASAANAAAPAAVGAETAGAQASPSSDAEDSADSSTAQQIDDILNQLAGQVTDDESEEPAVGEPAATEAAVSADAPAVDEPEASSGGDDAADTSTAQQIDDILAQLSGQLTDGEAEEAAAAEPEAAASDDSDEQEDSSLSVEQIDALLAEEAEQTATDDFETPTEIPVPEGAQAPSGDETSDTSASGDTVVAEDESQEAQPVGQQGAEGGFTAGAADVAAELDDQPESKPRASGGAASSKPGKKDMAGRIVVCKRALWQTCAVINRPLDKVPGSVRDAVGYAAMAHVAFGSILILSKLVGII